MLQNAISYSATYDLSLIHIYSSRRFLLILGMGALLSAVSAGVAVSAVILYHLGIIFGFFLPYKPVKKSFGICG